MGVWKFWGPEGTLEPSFLISEGNGPGAGQCLALGHTVITHQPFLLPEGQFWKPEACVPFPQSLWTPARGPSRMGKDIPQGSGAASTDTLYSQITGGSRAQRPAQGSDWSAFERKEDRGRLQAVAPGDSKKEPPNPPQSHSSPCHCWHSWMIKWVENKILSWGSAVP